MKFRSRALLLGLVLVMSMLVLAFAGTAQAQSVDESQQARFEPPIMIVNTSFLNIRTGPGSNYAIMLTVVGGTELPVLGSAGDGVWFQVSTVAGIGWLNSQFAVARGDFTNVPEVDAPPLTVYSPDAFMTTTETGVVGEGAAVPSSAGGLNSGSFFGSSLAWGVSVTVEHPARSAPTINSPSPGQVFPATERVSIIVDAASGDGIIWYKIRLADFGDVWVESTKSLIRPHACSLSAVFMTVPVRPSVGPDGSGTLTGERLVQPGEEAYLIDAVNNNYKIELYDGEVGWVRSEDVGIRGDGVVSDFCAAGGTDGAVTFAPADDAAAGTIVTGTTPQMNLRSPAHVIVNTGNLNIRSGPGANYTTVATVSGGTRLDVAGFAPDGVWYLVIGSFGRGWLNSEFVVLRGDGSSLPVIRDFQGEPERPVAIVTNAVVVYATPSTASTTIGSVSGPFDANVLARTADNTWVQIETPLGFGWVQTGFVGISGDLSLIPVVAG